MSEMIRVHDTVTGRLERRILAWFCARLPGWVTSDMLTALGVLGAALSFFCYWQAGRGSLVMWLACGGVVLNWFGDSLDGTLARHRKTERPKYGLFLDHMTDTFAMALIALGIGLSPHALLVSGMAVLLGYYAMVIMTLVSSHATGVFQISFNGLGPTEIRLFIIVCTIAAIFLPIPAFDWNGVRLTIYDAIMLGVSGLLVLLCLVETIRTLRALAVQDPLRR